MINGILKKNKKAFDKYITKEKSDKEKERMNCWRDVPKLDYKFSWKQKANPVFSGNITLGGKGYKMRVWAYNKSDGVQDLYYEIDD